MYLGIYLCVFPFLKTAFPFIFSSLHVLLLITLYFQFHFSSAYFLLSLTSDIKMTGTSSDDSFDAIPPNQYDMMLSDINEKGLRELGEYTGIENLSEGVFPEQAFPVRGWIFGPNNRMMVCLVCRRFSEPVQSVRIWFLVDTGSNPTYLARKTIKALIGPDDKVPSVMAVAIQDPNVLIECHKSPSKEDKGHFEDANVLGMDTMRKLDISIEKIDWRQSAFRLVRE